MEEERFLDGSGKKLQLVAHTDDESIAASFFLQRQKNTYVVFATSGDHATSNSASNNLGLNDSEMAAGVVDGQHRT
jgi:hypothetical protein